MECSAILLGAAQGAAGIKHEVSKLITKLVSTSQPASSIIYMNRCERFRKLVLLSPSPSLSKATDRIHCSHINGGSDIPYFRKRQQTVLSPLENIYHTKGQIQH